MKQFYILLSLLLLTGAGFAQTLTPRADDTTTPLDERLAIGKNLSIPFGPTPTLNGGLAREGSLFFSTTDSLLYIYKGAAGWKAVANAESLSAYLLKADTASLSNRINLNANDTNVIHRSGHEEIYGNKYFYGNGGWADPLGSGSVLSAKLMNNGSGDWELNDFDSGYAISIPQLRTIGSGINFGSNSTYPYGNITRLGRTGTGNYSLALPAKNGTIATTDDITAATNNFVRTTGPKQIWGLTDVENLRIQDTQGAGAMHYISASGPNGELVIEDNEAGAGVIIRNGLTTKYGGVVSQAGIGVNYSGDYTKAGSFSAKSNGDVSLAVASNKNLLLNETGAGKVAIGTSTATEKLTINGYTSATGYKIPSGTSSQYLMADGSVSSGPVGGASGSGSSEYVKKETSTNQSFWLDNIGDTYPNMKAIVKVDSTNNTLKLGFEDSSLKFDNEYNGSPSITFDPYNGYTRVKGHMVLEGISFKRGNNWASLNPSITASRNYTLPDKSGTIALLSDITGGADVTGKANLIGGNTFTGKQVMSNTGFDQALTVSSNMGNQLRLQHATDPDINYADFRITPTGGIAPGLTIFTNNKPLTVAASKLEVSGPISGSAFVKQGGTSLQYLMADGSVSAGPAGGGDESNLVHKTGTETISGDKYFTDWLRWNNNGYENAQDYSLHKFESPAARGTFTRDYIRFDNKSNNRYSVLEPAGLIVSNPTGAFSARINAANISASQTLQFPNKSGTIALLSDITGEGSFDETNLVHKASDETLSGKKTFTEQPIFYSGISMVSSGSMPSASVGGTSSIQALSSRRFYFGDGSTPGFILSGSDIGSATKTFTLPDKSGSIALLSDVTVNTEGKANLSGGNTFTGVQTFDTAPKINVANMPFINPLTDSYKLLTLRQSDNSIGFSNALPAGGIGTGVVDNTEFSYLDNVSSPVQTQMDSKLSLSGGTLTGGINISNAQQGMSIVNTNETTRKSEHFAGYSKWSFTGGKSLAIDAGSPRITMNNGTAEVTLTAPNISEYRNIYLPDASGTIALTSDLTNKASLSGGNTFTGAQKIQSSSTIFSEISPSAISVINSGSNVAAFVMVGQMGVSDNGSGTSAVLDNGGSLILRRNSFTNRLTSYSLNDNRVIALPDASGTVALTNNIKTINGNSIIGTGDLAINLNQSDLVHKTGNETIDGIKTFTQSLNAVNGTGYIARLNGTDGYTSLFGNGLRIDNGTAYPRKTQYDLDYITHINANNKVYSLKFPTDITEDQLVKLPSTGGTLALTSDLSGKASLTGGNTFTGDQLLKNNLKVEHSLNSSYYTAISASSINMATDVNTSAAISATSMGVNDNAVGMFARLYNDASVRLGRNGYESILKPTTLTATRSIVIPDASGTMALTSDLSGKANLTGANNFIGEQIFGTAPNRVFVNSGMVFANKFTLTNSIGNAGSIIPQTASGTDYQYQLPAASGTVALTNNIKTINGNSIIGSGDLTVTPTYGTSAGTVAQGNDSRIINGQTAFGWGNHANAGYANNTGVVHVTGAETVAGIKTFTDQTVLNGALSGTSASFSGKVGIGTTNPDMALTVKGKIHAEEVKVDLNVPGPDYVFEKDYDLKSLKEVEKYITANKHLPEIPSAKTMEKEGIGVSDMQMKLLQKVEELTLYLIEQNKRLEEQQKEIELLKKKNK